MAEENECLYDSMLKDRVQYARLQKKDYSHVFRRKSYLDILRLSAISIGIGIVYAAETAFVSPTLLQIGIEHSTMTMVWGLSPILGLLLGPYLGSVTDRCRLSFGRRRPMMLLLSVVMLTGLISLAFGRNIGQFFGDDSIEVIEANNTAVSGVSTTTAENKPNLQIAVILTILGIMFMDFTAEICQNPSRAYMLDVSIPEDHDKVLSTFSVMNGLGSTLAFAIGSIDWADTALGHLVGGNLQAVVIIDLCFFVLCFCITYFSFREIPLPLIERNKLLQPLTKATIQSNGLSNPNGKSITGDVLVMDDSNAFVRYLKCIMPKSLWILSLTSLLCWMGHICYCLYFTDFVGEEVFHGDPTAPVSSEEYNLYQEGVRFGGLGMSIYALTSSIYSFVLQKLMVWVKPKYVYIFGIMSFAIGTFLEAAYPTKVGVIMLSITGGIVYATISTVPYILVANYHSKGCFEMRNGEFILMNENRRGIGTDISIISSMLFVAQLGISLSVGFLVTWTGTTCAIFYASSGLSVLGAVSAMFILYI
ncbi:proton-associated sugar transporter A-like [Eupeodes corollae]|uniref:proton-associated sugar transporter A-like n=1 Tax=Eupeodes corollae TaxID=290404 RepID=UPI00249381B4|nr:proton-associated sugar transporter A-like [Eupeodes corollae]XP_055903233.1 proton-associated sugar transporter A-like [Eupeodes corollae]